MNYIAEYWEQIEQGKITTSKRVKQQYSRLIHMLGQPVFVSVPQMDGTIEEREFHFDEYLANRPIEFIEKFVRQSLGATGQPIRLDLFQKAKMSAVFGFVDVENGMRLCNEVHTYEGRKNGKTTEQAALGLHMLVGDKEGGPQVMCVATKRDQARLLFNEAVRMVTQSPQLRGKIHKRKTDMYSPFNFGNFEPLASESNSLDGLNPHCAIIDELHALKDRNLYDVVKQAMYSRRQPLLSIITTAGFVRESIYDSLYEEDTAILDGIEGFVNPRLMTFIYELDNVTEWADYTCWQKANPGLGTIKDFSTLGENVEKAKRDPKFLPTLLTKDFNIRQTATGSWLTFDETVNKEKIDLAALYDQYALGGADLSSTTDLTCATLMVVKGDKKYVLQMYFMPEECIDRRVREDKVPYDVWNKLGILTICPGTKIDYGMVTDWFVRMRDTHHIYPLWVGYDPYNAQYWVDEMRSNGFVMDEVRQGAQTMSGPMKEMAAEFASHRIVYDNNPILQWCCTNVQINRDPNDNIRPVKGKNVRQRIDGIVSLIDAYVVYMRHYEDYRNMQGE